MAHQDIQLSFMEAKALLPGVTVKELEQLVDDGTIVAEKRGNGRSVTNALFSNDSVIEYAQRHGLWQRTSASSRRSP